MDRTLYLRRALRATVATLTLLLSALLVTSPTFALGGWLTDDARYAKPVATDITVTPILTVGETVPRTSGGEYRMVGIPDGIGVFAGANNTLHVMLNHELGNTSVSAPIVGGATVTGAFISEYRLDSTTMAVLSGDVAYTQVFSGTGSTPATGAFGRFCSGYGAGADYGFDRNIYFTGEESSGTQTFDGLGGVAVAVLDRTAYILPELSHFAKENVVPVPGTGTTTALLGLEDGPGTPVSQLYLYVGTKNPSAAHPLEKNGLTGGRLYVFASNTATISTEAQFHKGDAPLAGHWVEIPGAATMNDVQLDAAAQAAGAFGFVRVEDGSTHPSMLGKFWFATTGSTDPANLKGRLYEMSFDPANILAGATLKVLLEGAAGDPIVNPDNVAINDGLLLIQEDPNAEYRGAALGRDSSIWAYDTLDASLERVVEIDQTAVPDAMRGEWGEWETSGITALPTLGHWLFDVQAHSIDSVEASTLQGSATDLQVVQGGQLLMMTTPTTPTAITLGTLAGSNTAAPVAWLLTIVGMLGLAQVVGRVRR